MNEELPPDNDDEDDFDDIDVSRRRHPLLKASVLLGALLGFAVAVWGAIWVLAEIPKSNRELTYAGMRRPTEQPPRAVTTIRQQALQVDPGRAVATAGTAEGVIPVAGSGDGSQSTAAIQELATITEDANISGLIGRRVNLHVPALAEHNLVTFWVGTPDNRLLVVLHRDIRNGDQRQRSSAPAHGILTVERGQQTLISGTIQRVPSAEQRMSWNLTQSQTRDVEARQIYLEADSVRTEGHGG
jgi:hypothetical protein